MCVCVLINIFSFKSLPPNRWKEKMRNVFVPSKNGDTFTTRPHAQWQRFSHCTTVHTGKYGRSAQDDDTLGHLSRMRDFFFFLRKTKKKEVLFTWLHSIYANSVKLLVFLYYFFLIFRTCWHNAPYINTFKLTHSLTCTSGDTCTMHGHAGHKAWRRRCSFRFYCTTDD